MTNPPSASFTALGKPLADLSVWSAYFRAAEIPVLRETADALEAMRANEERTDANNIGEVISGDPLMTLKVLAYASDHRGRRVVTGSETVTAALVMMGISPFFRAFGPQPTVEDRLATMPEALDGLRHVLQRAHRGARFALAFAIHRTDPDAAAIHAAALMHEFAELLLWSHVPDLALDIVRAKRERSGLRSSQAQRQVLRIELAELQQALVTEWRLPALVATTDKDSHAGNVAARTVALAARLARHTAAGFDNPAVPDDIADIAALLNLSPAATLHLVSEVESQ